MALSKAIGDIIAEELECGICLDRFKSPRLLTCLHSFCEHCLQQCADQSLDGYLHCPTCREQTVIPYTGITGLKPDFRANKLLEALSKDGKSKQEATRNVETGVIIRKCPRHDERLKFYCKSCNICICADCTVLDHSKVDGHECVYLKEIVPQFRRDVAELVTQIHVKAKNLDSLSARIVATNQELDQKSSDIEQEIENEVAKIKTTLLDHSQNYIKKKQEAIRNIEKRIRADKKAVQDVATAVHQVASSRDDLEVAEMHHSLHESFKNVRGNDSDTTTLDNIQTKLKTLILKHADHDSSQHTSISLVQQDRVLERQNVPHAKKYYAVSKKDNDSLCVIYATHNGRMSYSNVQRNSSHTSGGLSLGAGIMKSTVRMNVRMSGPQRQRLTTLGTYNISGETYSCPFDILPNGQICYMARNVLYKGSTQLTLPPLQQEKDSRGDETVGQGPSVTVNREGYIYVASACLDFILEISPNNTILSSKPIGNIVPFGITICGTRPYETILIAHKPASVSLIDSQRDIQCIFSDDENWENAAITCGSDGRVYLLSSRDSKITLQILDKEGNLRETIFRDRPVTSHNQALPEQSPQPGGFSLGTPQPSGLSLGSAPFAPARASSFGGFDLPYVPQAKAQFRFVQSSASHSSPISRLGLPPRLSIAVASNGDIAAVLGEDELVLITLQEIDVRKT